MSTSDIDRYRTQFFFSSSAVEEDTFEVISFAGEEAVSGPYRFDIDLISDDSDIDIEQVIRTPARLTIDHDGEKRTVHGVLQSFEQGAEAKAGRYYYYAVLVPRLWLMTLSRQNQIYQQQSVPDILKAELLASNNKGAQAGAGLTSDDFEFLLTRKYPQREYVVQYAESDFNFISRLMERDGVYYFFKQGDDREKLTITDDNLHVPPVADDPGIAYRPPSEMVSAEASAIHELTCQRNRIPGRVVLKDYNYRIPHVPLQADRVVDPGAHGLVSDYGDHFERPEEGQALAVIRSQQILSRQVVYQGGSNCLHLTAGHKFKLEEHFRDSFNQEYMITSVRHEGRQPLSGAAGISPEESAGAVYHNRFAAIPADVAFRPERITPKPKLYGIMNAHVDSALLSDRAEIDDQGRYKVIMPFDLSGPAGGKATRYIRMAQPYGGKAQGMHFPLSKGTEVIWTCIDGDPDRPIIIGVVPNPLNPSVVNEENHTRNIIQTAHGTLMEFNDGSGGAAAANLPSASGGGPDLKSQQQMQPATDFIMASVVARSEGAEDNIVHVESRRNSNVPKAGSSLSIAPHELVLQQQQQSDRDTFSESGSGSEKDVWFRVKVPEYEEGKESYLRLGAPPGEEANSVVPRYNSFYEEKDHVEAVPDGWVDFTDGDNTSIAKGNRKVLTKGRKEEVVEGTYNLTIADGGADVYDAQAFYNVYWHRFGGTWLRRELQYLNEMNFTTGTSWNMFVGSKLDATIAAALNFNLGIESNLGAMIQYENVLGPTIHHSNEAETKARKMVLLRVDPEESNAWSYGAEAMKVMALAAGVALTATAGAAAAETATARDFEEDGGRTTAMLGSGLGVAAAAGLAVAVNRAAKALKDYKTNKVRHSTMIKMDKKVIEIDNQASSDKDEIIELKCGKSRIVLHADGYIEIAGINIMINAENNFSANSPGIGLIAGSQGEALIAGKEVTIDSFNKTTIASSRVTAIEGNQAVNVGGPDTKSVKVKQTEARGIKRLKVYSARLAASKAPRPPGK